MSPSGSDADGSILTPEEAYTVLGNEVRIQIIRTLHEADEPLGFAELFDRIEYDTASNFSYHLTQLVDHFVNKTEAGYSLSWTGLLVARSAILAGQVTAQTRIEPTGVDAECPLCGAPLEVSYDDNIMKVLCTDCIGIWEFGPRGLLITFNGPPMAFAYRTAEEAFHAMAHRRLGEIALLANDICPLCAATVEHSLVVCTDHGVTDEDHCDACTNYFCTDVRQGCRECGFGFIKLPASVVSLASGSLDHVLATYGVPVPRGWDAYALALAVEEALLETEPVRLHISLPVDDEVISVTIDDDLTVLDHERFSREIPPDG